VTEFELPDPVVALQGSATAAAPHLVVSLDTRTRSGVSVRYRLRDIDPSPIANAVQPVAQQYRVGVTGDFASVPGGFVGDATTGPGAASLVTPVSAALPADADDKPLVQLRILTTNAVGQDEWVGADDIEVEANGGVCAAPGPQPAEPRPAQPPPSTEPPPPRPPDAPLSLTDLRLTPHAFRAATSGPAVRSTGRAGASLGFRVSRPATVQFRVTSLRAPGVRPRIPSGAMRRLGKHLGRIQPVHRENGRFSVRGRRGVNQLRFSGRLRGRALSAGAYFLTAQATDRSGVASAPATVDFRIRR
jgi:hypothetical protein